MALAASARALAAFGVLAPEFLAAGAAGVAAGAGAATGVGRGTADGMSGLTSGLTCTFVLGGDRLAPGLAGRAPAGVATGAPAPDKRKAPEALSSLLSIWLMVPAGVVTVMTFPSLPLRHSIRYPGGRKVLKPWMRTGWPRKRLETRSMTPGVSILRSLVHSRDRSRLDDSGEREHVTPVEAFCRSKRVFGVMDTGREQSHLAFELFHYVQEPVVHLGTLIELDLTR